MLGRLTGCIQLLIILAMSVGLYAQTPVSTLRERMAKAESAADSIVLLYNIYDASPVAERGEVLREIYNIAVRKQDVLATARVLRHSAYYYLKNDSMLRVLVALGEKLPDDNDGRSTRAYLNVMRTLNTVNSQSLPRRETVLRDLLSQHSESKKLEIYKRIDYLCRLCIYLRLCTDGDMLTNYQRELQVLIDNLPPYELELRYVFYLHAADTYLAATMIPEGVEANRKLLDVINAYKRQWVTAGYTFRKYDATAFDCYSRLLRYHESLTPAEVDDFYVQITSLMKELPDSVIPEAKRAIPQIYYLMAKKRYSEVIPLIRAQLANKDLSEIERLHLARELVNATEATGDKAALLQALEMSNDLMRKRLEKKAATSYKDLQMMYEVNDLKTTNTSLQHVSQRIEIDKHNEQLVYALTCLVVLVVLLVVVYILYRRSNRLTSNLTKSNEMITSERDAIQHAQQDLVDASNKAEKARRMKDDFVNSMGNQIRTPLEFIVEYSNLIATCTDKSRREFIQRFADVITLNSDLLITQVNEVLNLPILENVRHSVRKVRASAHEMCREAIEATLPQLKPGVELVFANENSADIRLETDPKRVKQVLMNLLNNAAKYTDEGVITLKYALTPDRDEIEFTVEDTGIGVPPERAETIFNRNVKHPSNTPGLYTSRLLAKILGGNLVLDKDYQSGAKFVFSIPAL